MGEIGAIYLLPKALKLPKVQKIAKSGHTAYSLPTINCYFKQELQFPRIC